MIDLDNVSDETLDEIDSILFDLQFKPTGNPAMARRAARYAIFMLLEDD